MSTASVGARANGPAHHHAVEAIDDRRQVNLAGGDLELCDVREPLLIGCRSLEVAVDDVLWCWTDLPQVRGVSESGFQPSSLA